MLTDQDKMSNLYRESSIEAGVDLRKKINWPRGPVTFLNNWPLQNSTGPRNIGPRNRKLKIEQYEPH